MKWPLVLATAMTCLSAQPPRRLTRDAETQRLPKQNETRNSSSLMSVTSNVTSDDTSKLTSRDTSATPWLILDSTSNESGRLYERMASMGCMLPTCSVTDLGSKLQVGDETAGGSTLDPEGFGKK
ncbi:uncharacterized protein zgc:193726 [Syngnathus typhle]|uniref:uncharacterized protein zgc:193726 n=1 Tax=Syngnathus typhle TaxID=161592 RepID=UPI002A6B7717|nr:uncharacterized protein zgc:193726 [Syngnathus typhle]